MQRVLELVGHFLPLLYNGRETVGMEVLQRVEGGATDAEELNLCHQRLRSTHYGPGCQPDLDPDCRDCMLMLGLSRSHPDDE